MPCEILPRRSDSTSDSFLRFKTQHGTLLSFTIIQRCPTYRSPRDGQWPRKARRPERRRYVKELGSEASLYLFLMSFAPQIYVAIGLSGIPVILHAICYLSAAYYLASSCLPRVLCNLYPRSSRTSFSVFSFALAALHASALIL